jgi:hypothetical protein
VRRVAGDAVIHSFETMVNPFTKALSGACCRASL